MPSRKSRGRRELHQTAEINVTSLVDVAFTLLIIFIITAPMMQGGITVDLAEGDVKPLESVEDLFLFTFTKEGRVFFEKTEVSVEDIESGIGQMAKAAGTQQIFIKADSATNWGPILRVSSSAMKAGLSVSYIAEPKPAPRP
jgi:biopolymer transport protein TolR